jgi:hypothetical protein
MEEQKIKWVNGLPELVFPDGSMQQICLRCSKNPALKDGTDEGEYYCKPCIEERNKVIKAVKEDELIHPKRVITDNLQLWEEKDDETEE